MFRAFEVEFGSALAWTFESLSISNPHHGMRGTTQRSVALQSNTMPSWGKKRIFRNPHLEKQHKIVLCFWVFINAAWLSPELFDFEAARLPNRSLTYLLTRMSLAGWRAVGLSTPLSIVGKSTHKPRKELCNQCKLCNDRKDSQTLFVVSCHSSKNRTRTLPHTNTQREPSRIEDIKKLILKPAHSTHY